MALSTSRLCMFMSQRDALGFIWCEWMIINNGLEEALCITSVETKAGASQGYNDCLHYTKKNCLTGAFTVQRAYLRSWDNTESRS